MLVDPRIFSFAGDASTKGFTARVSKWYSPNGESCRGRWVREICIFGVGDLPWLYRRPELFVNKFYADFEPLAYDCMEELIYNRTVRPHLQSPRQRPVADSDDLDEKSDAFDATYYLRLPFVRNKASTVVSLDEAIKFMEGR
jgi:hypothetical protein